MQEETTSTSFSQQENSETIANGQNDFSSLTSNESLIASLKQAGFESPSGLETQILKSLKDGQSVLVSGKRDKNKSQACCIAAAILSSNSEIKILCSSSCQDKLKAAIAFLKSLGLDSSKIAKPGKSKVVAASTEELLASLNDASLSAADYDLLLLDETNESLFLKASENVSAMLKKYLDSNPNGQAIVCLDNHSPKLANSISHASGGLPPTEINAHKYGNVKTVHEYYEIVSSDLLSKPNTLCDILQVEGLPTAAIFCNTPSDADLLDAILSKRGINSRKLIGNIPQHIARSSVSDCLSGKYNVLVVTDVSGQQMDLSELDAVINYSIHEDPQTYLDRIGKNGGLSKIISLVTPLDFGSFHFLKKTIKEELIKCELPNAESLENAKFQTLLNEAISATATGSEELSKLAKKILSDEQNEKIVSYLLHKTLIELPEAKQGGNRRNQRNDRNDRNDRNERYDDRRSRDHSNDRDERSNDARYNDRSESQHERREREPIEPPKLDIRYYLGHGLQQGITEEKLAKLITDKTDLNGEAIKRISIRDCYSFVDFDEEVADKVAESLEGADLDGSNLVLLKATSIAQLRTPKKATDESDTDNSTDDANNEDDSDVIDSEETMES